jgi:hypothetical protein
VCASRDATTYGSGTTCCAVRQPSTGRGCCKLTLEVQDGNTRARGLYESFGFTDFVVGDSEPTRFLSKPLD